VPDETSKLIVPAHEPIKRSTLSHILKQARLTVEELERLL
jgi:predicted RNA binding protein YcfA (HicA-like mRNA interferase family)